MIINIINHWLLCYIVQKLIGKDEASVMQELIDERSVAIEEIHKGLVEVNKMFKDLSDIVKDNQVQNSIIFINYLTILASN